eukprot:Skav214338  [mRNA]  locus=scaffold86:371695:372675:+ [translate_table: standard]
MMMFFHANAEDLGLVYNFCSVLRDMFQVNVLAVEYPGYGICQGTTSEANIIANAEAAMDFVTETLNVAENDILLLGRSLGTGPAIALAARYQVAGVILVSPFASIKELFQRRVGRIAEFLEDRFQNLALAPKILSPTLIIHGLQDALVPPEHGRRIYASLACKRMMVTPASMTHNSSLLRDVASFVMPMTRFFSLPDYAFEEVEVPSWAFPTAEMGQVKSNLSVKSCVSCCAHFAGTHEATVEPISRLRPDSEDHDISESAGIRFEESSDDEGLPTGLCGLPQELTNLIGADEAAVGQAKGIATKQVSQKYNFGRGHKANFGPTQR